MRTGDGRSITVRNIIWDIDGTLFDTYPAIARAFKRALNELGSDAPLDRIAELARESLGHCATTLAGECQVDLDQLEAAFGEAYDRTGPDEQPPFPGARAICEHICRIAGQNVVVTHRGPKGTAELLSRSGLAALFADRITGADGFPRKPDPGAFHAIIERRGLRRDETMAIGDREIDVAAGRAAGVHTCFFGRDPAVAPDVVIDDFADLGRLLGVASTDVDAEGGRDR
jgi:phosphoglycolate phosphatase-like HAD superfamily hydrolase